MDPDEYTWEAFGIAFECAVLQEEIQRLEEELDQDLPNLEYNEVEMADSQPQDQPPVQEAEGLNVQELIRVIQTLQIDVQHLRQTLDETQGRENELLQHVENLRVAAPVAAPAGAPAAPAFRPVPALGRARASPPEKWYGDPDDIPLEEWLVQLRTYFECTETEDHRQ